METVEPIPSPARACQVIEGTKSGQEVGLLDMPWQQRWGVDLLKDFFHRQIPRISKTAS